MERIVIEIRHEIVLMSNDSTLKFDLGSFVGRVLVEGDEVEHFTEAAADTDSVGCLDFAGREIGRKMCNKPL